MIKAIAIDDEPPALQVIQAFCSKVTELELSRIFTKTQEAQIYLKKFPVDLLFLDINMPSISGLEFSKMVPEETMVIFVTAHSQFALEGFNLNAIDYLLKPFTFDRFMQAVNKVLAYHNVRIQSRLEAHDHLLLRNEYALVKVQQADILYVEGVGDYIKIHLKGSKPLLIRMTMKALIEKLPPSLFVRVHRSYIVSLQAISSVRNKTILIGQTEIPISTNYQDDFFTRLGQWPR